MRKILFLGVVLLFLGCKSEKNEELIRLSGDAFGTIYNVQYEGDQDFTHAIDSIVQAVNNSVSTYQDNSLISKINQGDSTVVIDQIFKDNFELSKRIHQESFGYFDPTVGVLRNAYGFGTEKPIKNLDSIVLDSLRQLVGLDKVKLSKKNTLVKLHPKIYLDFNAIAKGYGIDLIGEFLEGKNIKNYLVELGGEIRAQGKNTSKNQAWKVGVEGIDSQVEDRSYTRIISLVDEALASSGNYRKFRVDSLSGKKFVHTINPLDGKAEQSDITSASVIANTCAEADAYATAIMAMGKQNTLKMLETVKNIEVYFTYLDSLQKPREYSTQGFKNKVQKE
ncbi:FAD:protein FMN transferase [Mesonia sp. K7]|uniref:FAD:protein FMN transferase n=1 Tax=Mesonia sp. K7 TaxID=2218606 RepID=UPI000DA7DBD5|nr:FAD:protein FMN transferase [Mesonia sp. K7]PZD77635.1 FAD:protein FMN transferase [Mesonia sp. K7]